jgi:hypothetical protein
VAKQQALALLETDLADPAAYKSGEYLEEHVLRGAESLVGTDRAGLIDAFIWRTAHSSAITDSKTVDKMRALVVLIHIIFPAGSLLLALPMAVEVVPYWLNKGENLPFAIGVGIPIYVGLVAAPGYAYYVIHRLTWRRARRSIRIWVRASLLAGAIAATLGTLWTLQYLAPLSLIPLVTAVLCVLGLRGSAEALGTEP